MCSSCANYYSYIDTCCPNIWREFPRKQGVLDILCTFLEGFSFVVRDFPTASREKLVNPHHCVLYLRSCVSCSEPLLLSFYQQSPELSAKYRQVPPLAQQSPRAGLFHGQERARSLLHVLGTSTSQERFTLKHITAPSSNSTEGKGPSHRDEFLRGRSCHRSTDLTAQAAGLPIFLPQETRPHGLKPALTALFPQVWVRHLAAALSVVGLCSWGCPALALSERNRWCMDIQSWMCLIDTWLLELLKSNDLVPLQVHRRGRNKGWEKQMLLE